MKPFTYGVFLGLMFMAGFAAGQFYPRPDVKPVETAREPLPFHCDGDECDELKMFPWKCTDYPVGSLQRRCIRRYAPDSDE